MKPKHSLRSFLFGSSIAAALTAPSAYAVDFWYDGGTQNWSTVSAWSTVAGAATPDPAAFPNNATTANLFFNRTNNNAGNNSISLAGGSRAAASMTFNTSGTTQFNAGGSSAVAVNLSLGAGGITLNSTSGAVTVGQATTGTITVVPTGNQIWTNNSASTLTVNGPVGGGAIQLTKSGTGTVRLNGANTYTGATIVDGGALLIGNYAGLDNTSGITVSGGTASLQIVQVGTGATSNTINKNISLHGTLRTAGGSGSNLIALTWDGDITVTGDSTIFNNGNSTIDVNGDIDLGSHNLIFQTDRAGSRIDGDISGGGGSFTKTSTQNLTLTGTNTYTGSTTISGGSLVTALPANLAGYTDAGKVIFDGGRLDITMGDGSATGWSTAQADSLLANATKTSGNLGISTANGSITQWAAFDSATNFGNLGLVKLGANTLTLDTANTHAATTIVNAGGTLRITHPGALGSGNVTIGTSGASSGTLEIALTGTNTITNTFGNFSSANGLTNSGGTAQIRNISGDNTITGDLTIGGLGGNGLNVASDGGLLTLSGTISHTVASIRTLSLGGAGDGLVTGAINNNSTGDITFALNKSGTGTWTLSNPSSNYTGATNISGGTLALGASGSIANSPTIIVGANSTFDVSAVTGGYTLGAAQTLTGSGTVTGAMTVAGTLSPGSSPGIMATGSQTWVDGGDYNFQMLDATGVAGAGFDQMQVTGSLDFSSLTASGFAINLWSLSGTGPDVNGDAMNFNNAIDQSWIILTTTGGITNFDAGDFQVNVGANNGTSGFSNPLGGGNFSLGADSNNLILSFNAVPEPSAALLAGIGMLMLLRRRR